MEQNIVTASKPIKIPGPDHPITIERNPARIVVSVAGRIVADTREALTLREAAYAAVQYIPRKDVDMGLLDRTDRATYCAYKGDCSYFSIPLGGERSINAVWSYEPHTLPSCRSRIISPSTPSVLTRSKNDERPDHPSLCQYPFGPHNLVAVKVRKWHNPAALATGQLVRLLR
jgi:uncharacterized protein (DUF427 family)